MKKTLKVFMICLLALMLLAADIAAFAATGSNVLTLPASLKSIKDEAFYGDTSIGKVIVPGTVTEICSRVFAKSTLSEIVLPERLSSVGEGAFMECKQLTKIVLPERIKTINSNTFVRCSKLESVMLPQSLTRIESTAFMGCSALKEINLMGNIEYIANTAFALCPNVVATVEEGSYAETWCKNAGITTKIFGDEEDGGGWASF